MFNAVLFLQYCSPVTSVWSSEELLYKSTTNDSMPRLSCHQSCFRNGITVQLEFDIPFVLLNWYSFCFIKLIFLLFYSVVINYQSNHSSQSHFTGHLVNQSKFEVNTCSWHRAWDNMCKGVTIIIGFEIGWQSGASFF